MNLYSAVFMVISRKGYTLNSDFRVVFGGVCACGKKLSDFCVNTNN